MDFASFAYAAPPVSGRSGRYYENDLINSLADIYRENDPEHEHFCCETCRHGEEFTGLGITRKYICPKAVAEGVGDGILDNASAVVMEKNGYCEYYTCDHKTFRDWEGLAPAEFLHRRNMSSDELAVFNGVRSGLDYPASL